MTATHTLPTLITFDGEARSGKGTIVHLLKDALRDEAGYKVMLIDAGQVFRSLAVAATNRGVDLDDTEAIDTFLADDQSAEACVQFVKAVYHMEKVDRDALLYTTAASVGSAKIGARPLSQSFKDALLKKWLRDAGAEGYDIVLLDGRTLEQAGTMLEDEGLCRFRLGFYFICDPMVGAMRTLGFAGHRYDELSSEERMDVDGLTAQIIDRNEADKNRAVQPIAPPEGAPVFTLPAVPAATVADSRFMAIVDSSTELTKEAMAAPMIRFVLEYLELTK